MCVNENKNKAFRLSLISDIVQVVPNVETCLELKVYSRLVFAVSRTSFSVLLP